MGEYENIIGTLLVGIAINTYLFGMVSLQYASYVNKKFNDPIRVKAAVVSLFIIDAVHSSGMIYMAWVDCINNYANPGILQFAQWPYAFTPIATAFTAFVTHLFLGNRIYSMTKSRLIYSAILVLTAATFATGVGFGIKTWFIKSVSKLHVFKTLATCWLAIQVAADIAIAATLSAVLHRHRTGFRNTDGVINRLIRGTVQVGLFSAICAMGGLIAFLVSPETNLYAMFIIPIGRTYTTTLMDTLNVRRELKEILLQDSEINMSDVAWRGPKNLSPQAQELFSMQQFPSSSTPKKPAKTSQQRPSRSDSVVSVVFSTALHRNKEEVHSNDYDV